MISEQELRDLASGIRLGAGHEDQERVVLAGLRRLLINEQRGVVLADEVGFGKTYEALAILSNLCAHERRQGHQLRRALVLCKPALVRKWEEETSAARAGRGFPHYIPHGHPARDLFGHQVRCVDSRAVAWRMRDQGERGRREDGRNQVPHGLYIVNERLLLEPKRRDSVLLRQMWNSKWDVVIVDEAHHYARGNQPVLLFAPDKNLRNYEQEGLLFKRILALTATPFELTPREMVNLLALVRADRESLDTIEKGLQQFERALTRFFELRERSPNDALRVAQVRMLQLLRDHDTLNKGEVHRGLEALLRRFLIRNTKTQHERKYFLTQRVESGFDAATFHKLDDNLRTRVKRSPLIPFEREHVLFYLELRALLQEVTDGARRGETTRTFIPTDLRQGLSSYPQIAASKLLQNQKVESASRLRSLVDRWNADGKLHPKVGALVDVVRIIAAAELQKLGDGESPWLSKILIFNKLIAGTAPQLTSVLSDVLEPMFDGHLDQCLREKLASRSELAERVRKAVDTLLDLADQDLETNPSTSSWWHVPQDFVGDDFAPHRGKPLLGVFRESLRRRAVQTLALIDLVASGTELDDEGISAWVDREITAPVIGTVRGVIDRYLDDTPHDDEPREALVEQAERDLRIELEESKSLAVVGRFDGTNSRDRDGRRRNFNRRHNPFVLLVGQVGEEGIDLQEQCRYIIHYDLEWNPARMEQREGRVDRLGWGKASEGYIDVRFMLLKGTYEERIFHTVMQRDQWFQILIGSKRKELGALPDDVDHEVEQDRISEEELGGALTDDEKARVMLDLRPE